MNDKQYIFKEECCKNFHYAWSILDELEKTNCESHILKGAAYRMALIEYSKSYKHSHWKKENQNRWKLPDPNFLSKALFELHNQIIDSRDKFLAHADLDEKDPKLCKKYNVMSFNSMPSLPKLSEFKQLLEKTIDHIELEQSNYKKL